MKHLSLLRRLQLSWKAFRDPRTPLPAKVIAVLGILYAVSPLDFIPDVLPVIGWTDDLAIIVAAIGLFLRIARQVFSALDEEEHRSRVIDVDATERRQ